MTEPRVPFVGLLAVKVVDPVADAVLLVEGGPGSAHVRDAASVLVAHVEQHALELLVSVEAQRTVGAVERERHVRELLPALGLPAARESIKRPCLGPARSITYAMKGRQRVDERGGCGRVKNVDIGRASAEQATETFK